MDISVNHTDGVDVADIIKDYKTRMPALRPLALIMKNIVGQAALNDPSHSGIGSYALVCMCINFLQVSALFNFYLLLFRLNVGQPQQT